MNRSYPFHQLALIVRLNDPVFNVTWGSGVRVGSEFIKKAALLAFIEIILYTTRGVINT